MPWDAKAPNLGFTTGQPWLPPGPAHKALAVSEQEGNPDSVLGFARHFLHLRRGLDAMRLGTIDFIDAEKPVLVFTRTLGDEKILCVFNMSAQDAGFRHASVATGTALGLGCGNSLDEADTLHLGPYAARFAKL